MAQLWGGRFTKETDQLVYNFNASISFDQKFYKQDITGSKAHVKMLAAQGILTEAERDQILEGLDGILRDVENGTLKITDKYEDIHSFVEANLIDRIGDAGKKLHTGRSRNDQVALDMKLYTRDEIGEIDKLLKKLLETLIKIGDLYIKTASRKIDCHRSFPVKKQVMLTVIPMADPSLPYTLPVQSI